MPISHVGYLYMIESFDQGLAKIGHGNDPWRRRVQLQTGNPARLALICAVPAGYELERALHAALADYRVNLEWYRDLSLLRGIFCHFDDYVVDLDFDGEVPILGPDAINDVPGLIRDHLAYVAECGEEEIEPHVGNSLPFGDLYPLPDAPSLNIKHLREVCLTQSSGRQAREQDRGEAHSGQKPASFAMTHQVPRGGLYT